MERKKKGGEIKKEKERKRRGGEKGKKVTRKSSPGTIERKRGGKVA